MQRKYFLRIAGHLSATRGTTDQFCKLHVQHEERVSLRDSESPMCLSDHKQISSYGHIGLSLSSCCTHHYETRSEVLLVSNGAVS